MRRRTWPASIRWCCGALTRGEQEIQRPRTEKLDETSLRRAVAAAKEVVARRGKPDVGQMADAAALLVLFFLERSAKNQMPPTPSWITPTSSKPKYPQCHAGRWITPSVDRRAQQPETRENPAVRI
jgi:hypothetical protein